MFEAITVRALGLVVRVGALPTKGLDKGHIMAKCQDKANKMVNKMRQRQECQKQHAGEEEQKPQHNGAEPQECRKQYAGEGEQKPQHNWAKPIKTNAAARGPRPKRFRQKIPQDETDFTPIPSEVISGAFGQIVIGTHKQHDGLVVVKTVSRKDQDWAAQYQIYQEANLLLSELMPQHPNLPRLHDAFEQNSSSTISFVLEFCSGGDLYAFCSHWEERRQDIPTVFLSHVFVSLAEALGWLHCGQRLITNDFGEVKVGPPRPDHRAVLHRDIKLENIFLHWNTNSRSGLPTVVLGDFGLATFEDEGFGFGGTEDYLAPEVRFLYDHLGRNANELHYWETQPGRSARRPDGLTMSSGKILIGAPNDVYAVGAVMLQLLGLEIEKQDDPRLAYLYGLDDDEGWNHDFLGDVRAPWMCLDMLDRHPLERPEAWQMLHEATKWKGQVKGSMPKNSYPTPLATRPKGPKPPGFPRPFCSSSTSSAGAGASRSGTPLSTALTPFSTPRTSIVSQPTLYTPSGPLASDSIQLTPPARPLSPKRRHVPSSTTNHTITTPINSCVPLRQPLPDRFFYTHAGGSPPRPPRPASAQCPTDWEMEQMLQEFREAVLLVEEAPRQLSSGLLSRFSDESVLGVSQVSMFSDESSVGGSMI